VAQRAFAYPTNPRGVRVKIEKIDILPADMPQADPP
jgi:hypothetical protein